MFRGDFVQMKKEIFLSDIDISSRLKPNVVNLVYAPVGAGKSTWVKEKLITSVNDKREILYLTDTTAGRDQALSDNKSLTNHTKEWNRLMNGEINKPLAWGSWKDLPEDRVPIMTYSKMAHLIKGNGNYFGYGWLKHIVLDECHNLKIYQSFSKDNVLKALESWLKIILNNTDIKITALSATPKKIYLMFNGNVVEEVITETEKASLRTLKNNKVIKYPSTQNLLSNLPIGKGIIYTSQIRTMKEYAKLIEKSNKRKVEMIWSRNNENHPMTDRQWEIWDSILQESKIPDETDILMINASCQTGVNIKTPVDFMIIDECNEDTITQVRGRIRNDLDSLYLPSKEPNYFHIPSDFIGVPIYKDDKAEVLKYMYIKNKDELTECLNVRTDGHIKGWNTISELINESDDYCFQLSDSGKQYLEYRKNGKRYRYHIIQLKD